MFDSFKKLFGSSSANLKQMIDDGAIIIDVRTSEEYKSGHLQGSKNIPLNILSNKIAELKKLNKPVITVCRSGARSSIAKNTLSSAGINVCNGGSWTNLVNMK